MNRRTLLATVAAATIVSTAAWADDTVTAGFIFIGPRPDSIRQMGDKVTAIARMKELGIPCVPGSSNPIDDDDAALFQLVLLWCLVDDAEQLLCVATMGLGFEKQR
jgi:biotin carboxylase